MLAKLNLMFAGFVYFSIATIISQVIGLTYCWMNGSLAELKVYDLIAVVHGADLLEYENEAREALRPEGTEQASFDEIVNRRRNLMLDIDRRESAIDKSLGGLQVLKRDMELKFQRFDQLSKDFEEGMAKIVSTSVAPEMQGLQQSIETMKAKQAKDQLVQLVEEGQLLVVATIIKAMPINKRKKVLSEFKIGDEPKMRFQILQLIRLGAPERNLIRDTRDRLTNSNSQS